jgi:hypothetical protein
MRPGSLAIRALLLLTYAGVALADPPPAPPSAAPAPADATPAPIATPAPATAASVAAEPLARIPDRRFVINNLFVFRYNPVGIEDQIRAGFQLRLFKRDDVLFRDTFVHIGVYPKINPAYLKLGPSIEIQPLSMFNLRAAVELVDFFSSFGFLQSFQTPTAEYGDSALGQGQADGRNYATSGVHAMIEPLVQVKFRSFALRDKFAAEYWRMNVRKDDHVWYDATLDTLVPANGWVLTNDLDLLYLTRFGLTVGVRWSLVKPIYPSGAIPAGASDNSHQRIGAILAYTFFDDGFTAFNKPSLLVISSWYFDHRYRTGADPAGGGALPYVIAAFAFQSDLMQ